LSRENVNAGAEIVFVSERNMGNAVMRGIAHPAEVVEPITRKRITSEWEIPRPAVI
jgi:hypothetical protein